MSNEETITEVTNQDLSETIKDAVDKILSQNKTLTPQDLITAFLNFVIDVFIQLAPDTEDMTDILNQSIKQADYIVKCLDIYQRKTPVPIGIQAMALSMTTLFLVDIDKGDNANV